MVNLALKIFIKQANVTKTMHFDPACIVYDACRYIREKAPEAQHGQGKGDLLVCTADEVCAYDRQVC